MESTDAKVNTANQRFIDDPIEFLKENLIITYPAEAALFGRAHLTEDRLRLGVQSCLSVAAGQICYDLARVGSKRYVLRRLLTDQEQERIPNVRDEIPPWPANPVRGFYAPYLAGAPVNEGAPDISLLGQVSIETENDAPRFTFTGEMNGCAFVVTDEIPGGSGVYRVYHYQSTDSNPQFMHPGRAENLFPAPMRCFVAWHDYGPEAWLEEFTMRQPGLFGRKSERFYATLIFLYRDKEDKLRVVSQVIAYTSNPNDPKGELHYDSSSRMVLSFGVQTGDNPRPYTFKDRKLHVGEAEWQQRRPAKQKWVIEVTVSPSDEGRLGIRISDSGDKRVVSGQDKVEISLTRRDGRSREEVSEEAAEELMRVIRRKLSSLLQATREANRINLEFREFRAFEVTQDPPQADEDQTPLLTIRRERHH